jgi:hypothetical protein
MGLKVLIQTDRGKVLISIILGLGLATLFRKSCENKECMEFKGPDLKDIQGKVYQYEQQCYQFKPNPVKCSSEKKIVHFA